MKKWLLLALLTAPQWTATARAESILYTDGQNRSAPLELSEPGILEITSGTATQSGNISGGFGITKTGGGTLVFAPENQNDYNGPTVVLEGTLRMAGDYALSSEVVIHGGTLDLGGFGASLESLTGTGGTLDFGGGGSVHLDNGGTFGGAIIGNGDDSPALLFYGSDALVLSGNNQFLGSLYTMSGRIVSSGSSSYGQVSFYGGAFEVAGGETTVASSLYVSNSDSAGVEVNGGGRMIVQGSLWNAVYEGDVGEVIVTGSGSQIEASALEVADSGTGAMTLADGGKITVNGGAGEVELALGTSGHGTLNIGAASGEEATGAGIVDARQVTTDDGSGLLLFNHNETDYHFTQTGLASGSSVHIRGATRVEHENGVTYLTGSNDYTGGTAITGGTLVIAEAGLGSTLGTGGVTVGEEGALAGNGRVLGHATVAGRLSPGNSAGELTFANGLTLEETALVALEIGGGNPLDFDQISVGGALIFDGVLSITFIDGFTPQDGDTFQLFTFTGSASGFFDEILFSDPYFIGEFDYATGVLTVAAVPEPSLLGLVAVAGGVAWRLRRQRVPSV